MSPRLNVIEKARRDPPADPARRGWIRAARLPGPDAEAQRVREAGGPVDSASYSCSCGFVFRAAVSTSVRCPHCGTTQDW